MAFRFVNKKDYLHVSLSGEMNYLLGEQFYIDIKEWLEKDDKKNLLIDFKHVGFIDSYYIGVMMKIFGLYNKANVKMAMVNLSNINYRMFVLSGMKDYLPIFSKETEGLDYLSSQT